MQEVLLELQQGTNMSERKYNIAKIVSKELIEAHISLTRSQNTGEKFPRIFSLNTYKLSKLRRRLPYFQKGGAEILGSHPTNSR